MPSKGQTPNPSKKVPSCIVHSSVPAPVGKLIMADAEAFEEGNESRVIRKILCRHYKARLEKQNGRSRDRIAA